MNQDHHIESCEKLSENFLSQFHFHKFSLRTTHFELVISTITGGVKVSLVLMKASERKCDTMFLVILELSPNERSTSENFDYCKFTISV